jgi:hypothetical protein
MYDQMIQATLAGQGVALGRSPLIDSLLRQRKLVAPFSQTMASPRSYYLIQSAAALRKPEVQSFIEWLRQEARADADAGPAASRGRRRSKHPAGIQHVRGVERPLDRAHQLERDRRLAARQVVALDAADAVLCRERAAARRDRVVDQLVDAGSNSPTKSSAATPSGACTL